MNSATDIAQRLGVSDKFIAITILAGGTSMPELATCVAAAVKKKGQLALGNIIGSNVFNILLILGGSALIHPLSFTGIGYVDLGARCAVGTPSQSMGWKAVTFPLPGNRTPSIPPLKSKDVGSVEGTI